MKKHIYAAAILCSTLPFAARAQTDKGSFLAGANIGTASLYFGSSEGNYGNISVASTAGYFVANNFAVGLHFSGRYQYNQYYKIYSAEVAPFARFYIPVAKDNKEHNLRLFGEISAGIGGTHEVERYNPDTWNSSEYFGGAGVGVAYFFNPHISLETALNVYGRKIKDTDGVQYNPNISIGFNIYLFKNKK